MFFNPYMTSKNIQTSLQGKRLRGKVIAHHPDKNGMVKIRMDGVHDDWPEDCIPWQQADAGFGHGNNQVGQVKPIPPVGATTYSRFLSDNQYHPVYTEGPSSDDKKIDDFTNEKVYPYAYGSVDQGGHKEVINTKEGEESYTRSHVKGTTFGIDKDGNLNHASAAGLNQSGKTVNMSAQDAFNMSGKSGKLEFDSLEINAKALVLKVNGATVSVPIQVGGGSPSSPTAPTLPSAGKRPTFASKSGSGNSGGTSGAGA